MESTPTQALWPIRPTLLHILHGADTARPLLIRRQRVAPRRDEQAAQTGGLLYLEPIHATRSAALLGAEATLGGVAGGHGIAWLLHTACQTATTWRSHPALAIALKLPRDTVCDPLLVEQVVTALHRTGLSPARLEIALDSEALDHAGATTLLALSALRDLGVGLALAGLGAAPTQGRLRRLPLTCLRLQPSLPPCLEHSRDARQVVVAAIRVAQALDAVVVATGVGTDLQRDILADLGCHGAQGSLFGPPMPAARFGASLVPRTDPAPGT